MYSSIGDMVIEEKCQHDRAWLNSGKTFSPKHLSKMLTFYIKNYKKKFGDVIAENEYSERDILTVKEAIGIYMSKDWVAKLLLPKGSEAIEAKNHNGEINKNNCSKKYFEQN